jgi:hypothetical protein
LGLLATNLWFFWSIYFVENPQQSVDYKKASKQAITYKEFTTAFV